MGVRHYEQHGCNARELLQDARRSNSHAPIHWDARFLRGAVTTSICPVESARASMEYSSRADNRSYERGAESDGVVMRTLYDHVEFFESQVGASKRVTKVWSCQSKAGSILGFVRWWAHWRRYCFFPERDMLFDANCLWDIADFVAGSTTEQKEIQKQRKGRYIDSDPCAPGDPRNLAARLLVDRVEAERARLQRQPLPDHSSIQSAPSDCSQSPQVPETAQGHGAVQPLEPGP